MNVLNYTIDDGLRLTTSLCPAFLQVHVSETFVSIFSLTPTVRFLYWSPDVSYLTVLCTESFINYAQQQTAVAHGLAWPARRFTGRQTAAACRHSLRFSVTVIPVIL